MLRLLKTSRAARILTLVLLLQAGVFYGFSRPEHTPAHASLAGWDLPVTAPWQAFENLTLDQETLEVLKADDILSRVYRNNKTNQVASLFVAYFQTQRTGKTPHSPKNCLPGSGWMPSEAGVLGITVPGQDSNIEVNRYVVARGDNESVVLYWYQSHSRVVASEYRAKLFTVADSIHYHRSDTALVRVVVAANHGDTAAATTTAVSFVQSFFGPLKMYLGD
jgi:EpsI family protein